MTGAKRVVSPPAKGPTRSMWIVGAVVLVVGIALVAAIAVSSSNKAGSGGTPKGSAGTVVANGSHESAPVTVSGAALPEFNLSASTTDAAVGQTAPTLTGVNFAGEPITIGNDGKPKVIMFLAHWCPHCQAEVPRIQNWLDEHGLPSDVSLYAMPTSTNASRPNYPPSAWLVGKNWTVPVLVDSEQSDAATAYGLTSFPYFVVIGADGKVVERTSGELSMTDFAKLIDSARTGHPQ